MRWASFDCYGTLIDWERGIGEALVRLWPDADPERLLEAYHEIEPTVQEGSAMAYREVLAETLRRLARTVDRALPPGAEQALADSLPTWPPFPEVPEALRALQASGWSLAILSNTDPDLLAASMARIGIQPDLQITAAEAGSYKPAHGHWERFRKVADPDPDRHVHVAASLFHDIAPCADLGISVVWINRKGEVTNYPRAAELRDLRELPPTLDSLISSE